MNYPLISEYIEAIKAAEENFDELTNLRPVLDEDGEPVMTSGNFAVVFKMKNEQTGKLHAVKCFLKEQEGRAEAYRMIAEELEYVNSTFLTPIKYLDKELFVDSKNSDEMEFPVLLMDWVEGQTLDKYIREHIYDQYELSLLAYQFSRLAMWLLPQPFAHGDLKPDNILVKDDGTLVLVDYDGMYVPAMKGQNARELGSPDFRHPGRTEDDFDEHIDDFSLASILLSLKAISLKPALLEEYGASDRLLFSEKDYRNMSESSALGALQQLMLDAELASLYSLYILALSQNNLSQVSFRLFNLSRPEKPQYGEENLSTEVTEEDLANAWKDEYGVMYSKDGIRLIKADSDVFEYLNVKKRGVYYIKEGTKIICDNAFNGTLNRGGVNDSFLPGIVVFPDSVIAIGNNAFNGCEIGGLELSKNLLYIGDFAFKNCPIKELTIPSKVFHLGKNPFSRCSCSINCKSDRYTFKDNCLYTSDLKKIICCKIKKNIEYFDDGNCVIHYESISVLDGVQVIGADAFSYCDIWRIVLPPTISIIEEGAFANTPLSDINIPLGVSVIEDNTFWHCNLRELSLPNSLKRIGKQAFGCCSQLIQMAIPIGVVSIGERAFTECRKLTRVTIPESVSHIGCGAFNGCDGCVISNLSPYYIVRDYALYTKDMCKLISCFTKESTFIIPEGVQIIGENAFENEYLRRIVIPDSVISIEQYSMTCQCLRQITIPGNVKSIKDRAFWFSDIEEINILEGVEMIGNEVFSNCRKLNTVNLPLSLKSIGDNTFDDCWDLATIYIPIGTRSKFEELLKILPQYSKDILIEQEHGWRVKESRPFSTEEIAAVKRAEVVSSKYGNSVCFFMQAGGQTYIPLCESSTLSVGDTFYLTTAKVITLCREGKDDIYRVIE